MKDTSSIVCGSFELLEPVAEGGIATIWRGEHLHQGIPAAVKVITGSAAREPETREAFRREVQAHASLDHPGVVDVFEYGTISSMAESASRGALAAGSPYCALEYTEAGSLRDQDDVDNWPLLRSLLLEVLDALAHAHARGVIHRDLKPQNILYFPSEDRGRFKLSDFGIAHAIDSEVGIDTDNIDDAAAGTPQYMPPEQLQGEWRVFGPWTDLYAVGCMAFEIVQGELPFDAEHLAQVAVQQLTQEPPPLEPEFPVPRGFQAWVRCLMAKDLRDRFRRAADASWLLTQMPKRVEEGGHASKEAATTAVESIGEEDSKAEFTGERPTTRRLWSLDADEDANSEGLPTTTLLFETAEPALTTLEAQTTREMFGSGGHHYDLEGEDRDPLEIAFQEGPPPPLPKSWRYRLPKRPSPQVIDAGLDLFGLRGVPFVDRNEARDRIWSLLRTVSHDGEVRAVEISGASGTGKTRLAEWMARRAHELGGVQFYRASHSRQGGPTEGLPGMLESALNAWELDRERTYKRVLMEIKAQYDPLEQSVRRIEDEARALTEIIFPTPGGRADVDGPRYHFSSADERYGAVARLVEELSRERPIVLLFDDVQWGIDALRFVEALMARETDVPVLVLLTVQRETLDDHPVVDGVLSSLAEREAYEQIELGPLDTPDHAELINQLLPLAPDVAQRVLRRTDGIPLFAVQLLGDWVDRGVLRMGERGFTTTEAEPVPDSLEALWEDRVDWLLESLVDEGGADARRALELAAALGPHVDLEEWRAVCSRAEVEASDDLYERLIHEGLAWPMAQGWSFVHDQFVEVLEQEARGAGRWGEHNLKCAATLEALYPETDARRQRRLVEHYLEAQQPERALGPMLAVGRYLYEIAEYERLHQLLDARRSVLDELEVSAGDPRRLQNRRLRAQVDVRTGDLESGRELAESVGEAAERYEVGVELGWSHYLQGRIAHHRGELREALESLQRARDVFDEAGAERGLAWALKESGAVHRRRAAFDRARRNLDRASELFDRLDEVAEWIDVRTYVGYTWFAEGELERAATIYHETLLESREYGDDSRKGQCWMYIGDVRRMRRDWAEAMEAYEHAMELVASGDEIRRSAIRLNLALTYLGRRDYYEAERHLSKAKVETFGVARRIHTLVQAAVAASREYWRHWEEAFARVERRAESSSGVEVDEAWAAEIGAEVAAEAGAFARATRALVFAARCWSRLGREGRAAMCQRRMEELGTR